MARSKQSKPLHAHHPIHLDQEQLLAGLPALAYRRRRRNNSPIGKLVGGSRYFAKSESLFSRVSRLSIAGKRWIANYPSPIQPDSAPPTRRTNPGGCRFPGGLRQISWRRFSSPGWACEMPAPLRTFVSDRGSHHQRHAESRPHCLLDCPVLPSCILLRGTPSSPKQSAEAVQAATRSLPKQWQAVHLRRSRFYAPCFSQRMVGLTRYTSGLDGQRRYSKSGVR